MTSQKGGDLSVKQVSGKAGIKQFVDAVRPLYADDAAWWPPLMFERLGVLDPKKNPYFDHADAAFWVATRNSRPVGRISAQVDQLAQESHGPGTGAGTGHFGFPDTIDDPAVFDALIGTAENWLKDRGMTRSVGPFNLSVNEECGLLVEGFEHPARIMTGHARPHTAGHLERHGYAKAVDTLAYDLDVTREFPEQAQKILGRARAQKRLTLKRVHKKTFNEDLLTAIDIFNDAWRNNWGYIPMTDAEIAKMGANLKPFVHEESLVIAYWDGKPSAFMFAIPDINEAIADFDGRLLPFNWVKALRRLILSAPSRCRVPLMGVRQEFQNGLPGMLMAMLLIETIRADSTRYIGYKRAELSWVLEGNTGLTRILDMIGCTLYKRYRLYEKTLIPS